MLLKFLLHSSLIFVEIQGKEKSKPRNGEILSKAWFF